ncbi:MAG: hypothetical protein NVS4B8_15540 [Herpetosiphon sp.]
METSHSSLLQRLHEYVDTYITYLAHCGDSVTDEANADIHRVIRELETLQSHPDQATEANKTAERVSAQLGHLRAIFDKQRAKRAVTVQQQSLSQAFRRYLDDEIKFLARSGGSVRGEQANLLLGDIIADLRALSLHPDDEQATRLSNDLEQKRNQLARLERPWQRAAEKAKHRP